MTDRPLRVLALPVPIGVAELRGASNFNALVDLIRASVDVGYKWVWYVVLPARYKDELQPGDFPSTVKVIWVENECRDYYGEIAHTNSEVVRLFNRQYG